MKKKRLLCALLACMCVSGTTVLAANGSFNFNVAPNEAEKGAGAWINKGISENYAHITTNTFSGVGVNMYVKNTSYQVVSEKVTVSSRGYSEAEYVRDAPTGRTYQLYTQASYTSPYRITSLSGMWTP